MAHPDMPTNPVDAATYWCTKLMTDKLNPADLAAFTAWCGTDPENQTHLDQAIQAWQALDPISALPAMIDMRGDALKDFRRAQATVNARRRPAAWLMAACAALIFVMAGTGVWLSLKPDVYETEAGERRAVTLADGSRLSLDADTLVRVKYSGNRRQLWLDRGRANFEVAKNPERPFTVATAEKSVLATGTEFTVERLAGAVHVILYQGHVSVFQQAKSRSTKTLLRVGALTSDKALHPGEELISQIGSDQASVAPIKARQTLDWQTGTLVFEDEPLGVAVERVNRYTRHKISLASNLNPTLQVSGIYKAGDTDAFVDGVTTVSGLTYASDDGDYVLQPKSK